ncbi:MAG: aminopeptidase [Deltaproteobacteria bacterium]|nr:aminopeptidase [Deltaproteobacteria bacterium]
MLLLALVLLLNSTGCYHGHLAVGQVKLLCARQPVAQLLDDPETDADLRAKLLLVQEARSFAATLGLEVQGQYTSYVPWPHDRIVTNIITTKPGTIEAANFRFPIVGEVPYKGFFDRERAEREAERLRASGMDVCMGAIRAYSTLGWFDDPLTAPMLNTTDERLFETVIHELVHATVFVKSQPDFNEGVANFIGEEAVVLYYSQHAAESSAASGTQRSGVNPRARIDDDRMIAATLMSLRDEIAQLYAEELPEPERVRLRESLEISGREKLADLSLRSRSALPLSKAARINDACLAIQGTYVADTPKHQAVLEALDGDLERFVSRLRDAASSDDPRTKFFAL